MPKKDKSPPKPKKLTKKQMEEELSKQKHIT